MGRLMTWCNFWTFLALLLNHVVDGTQHQLEVCEVLLQVSIKIWIRRLQMRNYSGCFDDEKDEDDGDEDHRHYHHHHYYPSIANQPCLLRISSMRSEFHSHTQSMVCLLLRNLLGSLVERESDLRKGKWRHCGSTTLISSLILFQNEDLQRDFLEHNFPFDKSHQALTFWTKTVLFETRYCALQLNPWRLTTTWRIQKHLHSSSKMPTSAWYVLSLEPQKRTSYKWDSGHWCLRLCLSSFIHLLNVLLFCERPLVRFLKF